MKHKLTSLALISAFSLAIGTAYAQTSSTPGTMSSTSTAATPATGKATGVNPMDQAFFKKAAIGGMTEVEAGKLATTNAASPDVKAFGQQMVDDHTRVNDQLKQLAAKKSVAVPDAPDAKHQAMITALQSKQGAAFDAAFIKDMKMGHTDAIRVFSMASKSKDTDIASFATDTLPKLQEHEKMLMTLKPATKTSSTVGDSEQLAELALR